jgi:hypothetical protein
MVTELILAQDGASGCDVSHISFVVRSRAIAWYSHCFPLRFGYFFKDLQLQETGSAGPMDGSGAA